MKAVSKYFIINVIFTAQILPNLIIVSNTHDNGVGSLRAAILMSGQLSAPRYIVFRIQSDLKKIYIKSVLPPIPSDTILDATTQPGYDGIPVVCINGSAVKGPGFLLNGVSRVTIKGFAITDFDQHGISIINSSSENTITSNVIGINPENEQPAGNGGAGINVENSSWNTFAHNTISSNGGIFASSGVQILNNSHFNHVRGNFIGTNMYGSFALGNNRSGILVSGHCTNNKIGGELIEDRNIISGNMQGILLDNGSTRTVIQNNYLGTDSQGLIALGNINGIHLRGESHDNIIGGSESSEGNLISGNTNNGIQIFNAYNNQIIGNIIGLDKTGMKALGNSSGVIIAFAHSFDNSVRKNYISGNEEVAIRIGGGANKTLIESNVIGMAIESKKIIANRFGIVIHQKDTSSNWVLNNVISASKLNNIRLEDDVCNNTIKNNEFVLDEPVPFTMSTALDNIYVGTFALNNILEN